MRRFSIFFLLAAAAWPQAQPTLVNVGYGDHERQVLDFYRTPGSSKEHPAPLLFFIHGGGWRAGDKSLVASAVVDRYLREGISVATINYRYVHQAQIAGRKPPVAAPVEWPLMDAARALQFVRSKADEWGIDKRRIAASGSSAGACSSLWLAFHDDMAAPGSADPVAWESTRLLTAAVYGAQTSLDPEQLKKWTPNSVYGGHAFGFWNPEDQKSRDTRFAEFLEKRATVAKWIKMYSPYEHVSPDDPAVLMVYADELRMGQAQKDPTHTVNLGIGLREHCVAVGQKGCEVVYPLHGANGAENTVEAFDTIAKYLIAKLKGQ